MSRDSREQQHRETRATWRRGDRRGHTQQRIGAEGEPYLAKDFPLLDRIIRARVVRVYGPAAR